MLAHARAPFTREICTVVVQWKLGQVQAVLALAQRTPGGSSTWTESIKQVGVYFEGIVDDADTLLLEHTNTTVTIYIWNQNI